MSCVDCMMKRSKMNIELPKDALLNKEIVVTLSHKLSWSHFIEFIKIKDDELISLNLK